MTSCLSKILFLHGLDSSRESTKFHAINAKQKFCIEVDYRNLNFQTVADFYHESIETIKPDILAGHIRGENGVLKMSLFHRIPCVIANPSLHPDFRDDYPAINEMDLDHDIPQIAYIERGDEILDMYEAEQQLEDYMQVQVMDGGHHRLQCPENINDLIQHLELNYLKK